MCLRDNHEDAWLKVVDVGSARLRAAPSNGCFATVCSYTGDDPTGLWAGPGVTAIDAEGGRGGFLTTVELILHDGLRIPLKPARRVGP